MSEAMELTDTDRAILRVIDRERDKFGACTARQIARALGFNNSWISARLALMKKTGLVDFDPTIPGSIRRTGMIEVRRADYIAMLGAPEADAETVVPPEPKTAKAPATKKAAGA